MRIKLSRMGWNNVLIFASMFMILLFNYSHRMMTQGSDSGVSDTLVGDGTIIQSIDFNGIKLERLGSNWRTVTAIEIDETINPALIIESWTQQSFDTLDDTPMIANTAQVFLVVVWVAGEPNGWVYEFVIDNVAQTSYVKNHQTRTWFEIDQASVPHLIPPSLIKL